jgi:hypothetical protein
VAAIAVKGTSFSSKSLFPKLNKGKNTCLMVESKHKVKTIGSSPKYVSSDDDDDDSDDDTPFPNGINEKGITKWLGKELVARDQLLEVQFDAPWASTSKPSSTPRTTKASTSNGCERCYNVDIDALCAQIQHSNVEQLLVESCDEAIVKKMTT